MPKTELTAVYGVFLNSVRQLGGLTYARILLSIGLLSLIGMMSE